MVPQEWLVEDESAKEMLDRVQTERPFFLLPPLHGVPLRVGNVVEIVGPSPSAKTHILIQAAINCILPQESDGVKYRGLGRLVMFLDLDCHFDILRFSELFKLRTLEARGEQNRGKWKDIVFPSPPLPSPPLPSSPSFSLKPNMGLVLSEMHTQDLLDVWTYCAGDQRMFLEVETKARDQQPTIILTSVPALGAAFGAKFLEVSGMLFSLSSLQAQKAFADNLQDQSSGERERELALNSSERGERQCDLESHTDGDGYRCQINSDVISSPHNMDVDDSAGVHWECKATIEDINRRVELNPHQIVNPGKESDLSGANEGAKAVVVELTTPSTPGCKGEDGTNGEVAPGNVFSIQHLCLLVLILEVLTDPILRIPILPKYRRP
ncbi:hypothetical protein SLEP1_g41782 [Rubroshorea leprosula]|uniref:DNA repair protein XRCC2 homolog n=1 Tax=Rubroshorea leprosula TaxID=152421 RepID=A0AAV5L817_9ROSI|nr:hypothetical protein SLEP1_g41782 [Rubroshorea leprosula]